MKKKKKAESKNWFECGVKRRTICQIGTQNVSNESCLLFKYIINAPIRIDLNSHRLI